MQPLQVLYLQVARRAKKAKEIRGNKKRRATERQKGGRKREEVQTGMFLWVLGKDLG